MPGKVKKYFTNYSVLGGILAILLSAVLLSTQLFASPPNIGTSSWELTGEKLFKSWSTAPSLADITVEFGEDPVYPELSI